MAALLVKDGADLDAAVLREKSGEHARHRPAATLAALACRRPGRYGADAARWRPAIADGQIVLDLTQLGGDALMKDRKTPFSERHGYKPGETSITIQHDFPEDLRDVVVDIAYESGLTPHEARHVACRVLRAREDPSNWSAYPNVDGEVREKLLGAPWYSVYDFIEALQEYGYGKDNGGEYRPEDFEREINKLFKDKGIGWQLVDGKVKVRGPAVLERIVDEATQNLRLSRLVTAAGELEQAIDDLSGRPEPDVTGAVQHALAAVECSAREVTKNRKATLGDLIKHTAGFFPAPLDQAVEKIWGFASERGRHLQEGREPNFEEARLVVGLAAALSSYIATKRSI